MGLDKEQGNGRRTFRLNIFAKELENALQCRRPGVSFRHIVARFRTQSINSVLSNSCEGEVGLECLPVLSAFWRHSFMRL